MHSKRVQLASVAAVVLFAFGCTNHKPQPQAPSEAPPLATSTPTTTFGQAAPPAPTPPVLSGTPDIATLVEKVQPVVVNITISSAVPTRRMVDPFQFFFGPNGPRAIPRIDPRSPEAPHGPTTRERRSLGSGFVVDSDGYVVTNNHVIDGADEVTVRFADERSFDATVVGRDERLDIALLKLEGASGLQAAVLGDSDVLRVGETVMAMGNPFGLGHTVTTGIVSAKDRTIGAGPYDDFIQTDASINPGNSGGPLFNLRGELVGINTAIHREGQGIGFAIPINLVRDALLQLKDNGHVERGKLGVVFQGVNDDIARALGLDRPRGALVAEVEEGGPASRAGMKPGDLIVEVDGDEVAPSSELPRLIARNAPGATIQIKYLRDGKEQRTSVTLDALESDTDKGIEPAPKGRGEAPARFGLSMTPHDGGVQITGVSGSAAGKLMRGDIIKQVDGKPVTQPAQVFSSLERAKKAKRPALLRIQRGNRIVFVALEPSE